MSSGTASTNYTVPVVLDKDGNAWIKGSVPQVCISILDHKGNVPNAPRLIGSIIGPELDNSPTDLQSCPICYGTGESPIQKANKEFKMYWMDADDRVSLETIPCAGCNGRGKPPIPWGEVNGD